MSVKNVLIVDDSRLTRMIFAKIIATHYPQWQVSQAENGAQALEQLAKKNFDFISLDHNMPDRTGLEILPKIKELQPDAHIGVFTANVQQVLISRFNRLGATCYNKPLDEKKVLAFLSEGVSA